MTPTNKVHEAKMTIKNERVLIGSSNVSNFYRKDDFSEYPEYHMMKCTRLQAFKAQMNLLEKENKLIIISVIENFLADAARKGESDDPENYASNFDEIVSSAIQEYVDEIKKAATRLPESTFLIAKPVLRPSLNWFDLNFEEIGVDIKEKIKKINCVNVSEIESLSRASQNFAPDGVHLTNESGRLFVDCLINTAEAHYNAGPVVNIDIDEEDEGERMETNAPVASGSENKTSFKRKVSFKIDQQTATTPNDIIPRLEAVERGLQKLENAFQTKSWRDCLMTAKLREDLDFMTNVKNEDRIILTGLTSKTPPPQNHDEKINWIRNIAKEFVKTLDPESSEKINFVKQGRSNDKEIPMAEVRFETREIASKMRKMFVDKRKAGTDFGRVYMANCVTLATRVRVDIMKAIVKQFNEKDGLEMYVSAYTSRPVLRVKNNATQRTSVLTFTDAIIRFGKRLDLDNINDAYRRAGGAFKGIMEQTFVVLTDNKRPPTSAPQSGPSGLSKKRPLDGQQLVFNQRKEPRVERGDRGGRRGGGSNGGDTLRSEAGARLAVVATQPNE